MINIFFYISSFEMEYNKYISFSEKYIIIKYLVILSISLTYVKSLKIIN